MAFLIDIAKMPKSKAERVLYCRQWRKTSYDEKRFNKTVREYVEIKYKHIFSECTKCYEAIVKAHPEAKDMTKTQTFKLWKKANQQTPPVRVEEMPEPARVEEMPEPVRVEEMPEPARVEEMSEPARVEEMPEPARVEEMPEPARVEEMPEPARVEEMPEPARVEEMPEPARNILGQAIGELDIDQLDNRVQGMMEELQRDPTISELLNNEELFPPLYDEGIDMDLELEIDDVYDPSAEEVFR